MSPTEEESSEETETSGDEKEEQLNKVTVLAGKLVDRLQKQILTGQGYFSSVKKKFVQLLPITV